jgi:hypothetical protein
MAKFTRKPVAIRPTSDDVPVSAWPIDVVDIDDDAFARAIASARDAERGALAELRHIA